VLRWTIPAVFLAAVSIVFRRDAKLSRSPFRDSLDCWRFTIRKVDFPICWTGTIDYLLMMVLGFVTFTALRYTLPNL
jgi:hypothetical protein